MFGEQCYFYCNWILSLELFFIICVVLPSCESEAFCNQGIFRKVEKAKSLTNIISQHYVDSSLDCGQQCLHKETCVAFKYRSSKKNNEPNCQIGGQLESSTQADVTETKDSDWAVYIILDTESPSCLKNPCQNGGKCVGSFCEPDGYKCVCPENYRGKYCAEQVLAESCKSVLELASNPSNGSFKIKTETPIGFSNLYCQMTSLPGCSGGGWTMVMKINGIMDTFRYNSTYWSNNSSYNLAGGLTGFDHQETKLPTYWSTPFKELCVGMKVDADLNFISINYTAESLYSLFADGKYRATNLGTEKWKSLINNSSLQYNCTQEGFNIALGSWVEHTRTRLGIIGNEQNDCDSPDSFIGFGGKNGTIDCHPDALVPICGNIAYCTTDNGERDIKAMGYILVR